MIARRAIFPLVVTVLISIAGNARALDMGYAVQFALCFNGDGENIGGTPISLIDPGDGSIQSGALYAPMIRKVGARFVYPGSYLVHSGGPHFMTLETTKDRFLVWEFPVGRYFKSTDWSDWKAPSFEISGEYAEFAVLRGKTKKMPKTNGNGIWFRYRIIKYDPFASFGEIPVCPSDAG